MWGIGIVWTNFNGGRAWAEHTPAEDASRLATNVNWESTSLFFIRILSNVEVAENVLLGEQRRAVLH